MLILWYKRLKINIIIIDLRSSLQNVLQLKSECTGMERSSGHQHLELIELELMAWSATATAVLLVDLVSIFCQIEHCLPDTR